MAIASRATRDGEVGGTRRGFLAAGFATSVTMTVLFTAHPVFGQPDSEIKPFTFRARERA
jgi:hypothetical protein